MHRLISIGVVFLLVPVLVFAQAKTNETVARQIKNLGAEKTITLTFDDRSNTSKIMAVTDNFSDKDVNPAGVQAMNFAMGFFYPGNVLQKSPDKILLSIWVLTKKPRFAENRKLVVEMGSKAIDLGDARYAAKARENLEYLNFEITFHDLGSIAASGSVAFRIGAMRFSVTPEQLKVVKNLVRIADTAIQN